MNTFELDKEYVAATYARFPIEIVSGKGATLVASDGKEYIDMGSGIAVNTFGMCDEEWMTAVKAQLELFQHTSNLYYSRPQATLAEMLVKRTNAKRVFFSNSGAEANECAIKAARKYAADKKGKDTYKIITLKNSFHGRTVTTLAATAQDVFHKDFLPLTEGFLYAEANNIESVERLVKENKVAAIMFEPVQGEGGVLPLTEEFVKGISELCKREDILMIADEVQTGNGRTGKLYGYMHYGITPDILSTAKGLGGGLPIGATLLFEKTANVFSFGDHGSTFGGNPVSAAGAISILSRLDDTFLLEVERKSKLIFSSLEKADGVLSVSGKGLMIGISTEKPLGDVVSECIENGVLVLKAKDKLRLLPPLNISDGLLEKALMVIKKAVGKGV